MEMTGSRKANSGLSGAKRRRQLVLDEVAKDPCALDVIVWAATPLVPAVLDRLFEACASDDPPMRWALLGPREDQLSMLLRKLHASMPDVPLSLMPDAPVGANPHIVPVEKDEHDIFSQLVSRAVLVLQVSQAGMPHAFREVCSKHFVDIIDATDEPIANPLSSEELALNSQIQEGAARVRGSVVRLTAGKDGPATPMDRAREAVALIRAAVEVRGLAPHVCDGGQLCTSGQCSAGLRAAKL